MKAPYDSFDYRSYWTGRSYEHKSEVIAINAFLGKVKKINTITEVGCGFGRLTNNYFFRAKNIILSDPSIKLLNQAQETFKTKKNIKYVVSSVQDLPKKIRTKADVVVMVRVMHHIEDPSQAFASIRKIMNKNGYLIFEFANKVNAKAVVKNWLNGRFGYTKNTSAIDIRSVKNIKNKSISFLNYHPKIIKDLLYENNFEITDMRSVSNFRFPFLKRILPLELLLMLEEMSQKILSYFYFGPSIFILARKKG